ncbi:DUF6719 family protein [Rhizobium sp. NPDC090275]|uniref:DUF6719 family protein n=1 Tax=Rhizobium sp. NPDC090275 TaxID=3364498 RepID=UPI000DDDC03D
MIRSLLLSLSCACLLLLAGASTSFAAIKTVTAKPTVESMAPGESVLFDDKKCPAGMIAKFTKAQKRTQMNRKCVHQ